MNVGAWVGALAGSSSILLSWALIATVFIGIGLMIRRAFGRMPLGSSGVLTVPTLLMAFWMGLAGTVAFLQVWHFVFAVDGRALAAVCALGAAGLLWNRSEIRRFAAALRWRDHAGWLVATGLACAWLANQAMGPCTQHDSGTYHAQAVQWFARYPLVPGLGNLHGRLAFNNAGLLYAALLDVGPWTLRSAHLANGLLLCALLVQASLAGFRLWRGGGRRAAPSFFDLLLLAPILASILHEDVRSFTTDLTVAAVQFAAASRLFAMLVDPEPREAGQAYDAVCVGSLFALGVCLKLSSVVFAAVAVAVALGVLQRRVAPAAFRRALAVTLTATALLATSWALRGVVLSGYAAYPNTGLPARVEWRVPPEQADAERAWILYSGRYGDGTVVSGPAWFGPWVRGFVQREYVHVRLLVPVLLSLIASAFTAATALRRRGPWRRPPPGWLLLLPTAAGLIFWLATVAKVRFAFPLFWIGAATLVTLTFLPGPGEPGAGRRRAALVLGLLIGLLPLTLGAWRHRDTPLEFAESLFVPAGPDGVFHPMATPELTVFTTDSGLRLQVPPRMQCWNAPLPCTPHPAPNLRLRRPGDLSSGFVTDGRWLQQSWPNPWTDFRSYWRCRRAAEGGSDC